jgi:hypothetical protein
MSNKPKAGKPNAIQRRMIDKADAYSRGYHQGQADLLLNVKAEERKLQPEATAILLETSANAREFGDKRLAFIIETVVEWVGDPELVSKLIKESRDDNARKQDIENLA